VARRRLAASIFLISGSDADVAGVHQQGHGAGVRSATSTEHVDLR
jgi:hypothetical protein